jgi:folate-binding protein YgfZ
MNSMNEYQHAHTDAVLFDLSGRSLVEVAGKDAVPFLHNLCTNDIKGLAVGAGCEAFLTTAKARVVAHFFVSRLQHAGREVLWLDNLPGQGEALRRHLDHYLISEDVELTDRSGAITQLYLCGPRAADILDHPTLHRRADAAPLATGGQLIPRDHLGLPGYALFWPRDTVADYRRRLSAAGATLAGPETYEVLRVEAGFPEFGRDMDENRLVMEVGRTRQAVSFTKGCYLGQEPIVMARDRGHVNRTLLRLKLTGDSPAPAGAKVLHKGEQVGEVTSSVWSPQFGAVLALAYLRRGCQEPGTPVEVEGRPAEVLG